MRFGNYDPEKYRELAEIILSDRCWDCDEATAQGKCPDCDDPGEFCVDCLREHQLLVHLGSEV